MTAHGSKVGHVFYKHISCLCSSYFGHTFLVSILIVVTCLLLQVLSMGKERCRCEMADTTRVTSIMVKLLEGVSGPGAVETFTLVCQKSE